MSNDALQLARDIADILDGDCDATRVALYNPRATVAAIRDRLEQEFERTNRALPPDEQRD